MQLKSEAGRAGKVHLIGICGTAMASLAGMLKARGWEVRGSDTAAYPPMSDFLAELGIALMQPFAESNLEWGPDLVVVGNAISRGNPEVELVLDQRLAFTSMAELVYREFIRGRQSLVVAGTHGKTTTTSMLAWIFSAAGRDPSFLIGGIAENFGSSFAVAGGHEFIIEGDEYDTAFFDKGPKFMHYFPDAVILTSVEFDHADIYPDLAAVKTAFKRLVNLVPRRGVIVAWDGHANVSECVAGALCPVERYGFGADSFWSIRGLQFSPDQTRWTVMREGRRFADFTSPLAGDYNVLNATAAAAIASHYEISPEQIAEALASFRSVRRRLEVIADVAGVTIVDDFAHHPTAIAATLGALRKRYGGHRLWAILEPRSNTLRRNVFQHELVESLAHADEVVLAAVFFKTTDKLEPSERLDEDVIIRELAGRGVRARQMAGANEIVAGIAPELRAGDVVAILSNGGFGGIYEKLPAAIRALQER